MTPPLVTVTMLQYMEIQTYCVSDPSSCYNATVHGAQLQNIQS